MTKYLEGEEITDAELESCLHKAVRSGMVAPVLVGSAAQGHRRAGARSTPSCTTCPPRRSSTRSWSPTARGKEVKLAVESSTGPLVARVFKTTADPFVGRLTYLRVLSGTMQGQAPAWNATRNEPERIGQLLLLHGKDQETVGQLHAGEIGAVAKLTITGTGDTLCASREQSFAAAAARVPDPHAPGRDRAADEGGPRQDGHGPPAHARRRAVGPRRSAARPASRSSWPWATPTWPSSASASSASSAPRS